MKNRLLILTQEVDKNSTTLGFMHNWIDKLSKKYELIEVICLYKGETDLPTNVNIFSLGKEKFDKDFLKTNSLSKKIITRIKYILNFYYILFKNINKYDKVFVHMNDEYLLLGGLIWKIFGKEIFLWRNHYSGNFLTDVAVSFCKNVFYTSKFSYTAKFKNSLQMPVGADIESLMTEEIIQRKANAILSLARLDPSKNPEIILEALSILQKENINFKCDFVGGTTKDKWPNYEADILKLKENLGLLENVSFVGAVPSTETYKYYLSHDIYVNVAKSGMLDKTIFKALAAGCLPITTSLDFNELIFQVVGDNLKVKEKNPDDLADKLKYALSLSGKEKNELVNKMKDIVIEKHSLKVLINKISEIV